MMKVAVIGSLNMDMSVHADRIPAPGETLLGDDLAYAPGGKGANQAYAIARMGTEVSMFGCVGDDSNGTALVQNLAQAGVATGNIRAVGGVPTGLAVITIGGGDNTIIVVPGANLCVDKSYIDTVKAEILGHDIILLQQEIPMDTVSYVIDLCREKNKIMILNPAPAAPLSKEIIDKVDYITPNEHEAQLIFGNGISGDDNADIQQWLKQYPEKLIITMGSQGAAVYMDGQIRLIPARKAEVIDTTGAGDTFNGIFAAMLAREGREHGLEKPLLYANAGASLSTEKAGAQGGMPLFAEVECEVGKMHKK